MGTLKIKTSVTSEYIYLENAKKKHAQEYSR
jgi:hypothetical protein